MLNTQDLFTHTPIVPVVVINDAEKAVDLAAALQDAGLGAIEITLRTDAALDAIARIAKSCPGLCIGAGSVRSTAQIKPVLDAGARFCVSPGFTEAILVEAEACHAHLIPGAGTATEVLQLYERGYDFIKFFPAELSGGLKMIEAINAPLPEVSFFPTGGITAALATEYLASPSVCCVGGTWFVPPAKIDAGEFDWIRSEAADAIGRLKSLVTRS